jgi:hypothetical protein
MEGEERIAGIAVVCVLTSDAVVFDDNRRGQCYFCGRGVQYRPHIPTPHTLVCRICFAERVDDGDEVHVTKRSAEEAYAVLGRAKVEAPHG